MSLLFKKLIRLSIWNTAAAGINFLSNIIIAKSLGVAVFGELIYVNSLIAVLSLVYIILPSDFSIIRYQDDGDYKYTLSAFYLLTSGLLIIPVYFLKDLVGIPVWLFFLFTLSFGIKTYFDITLQAENKLKSYYFMLFLQALSKMSFIIAFYLAGWLDSFYKLVLLITISQLLVISYYLLQKLNVFFKALSRFTAIFKLIKEERKLFSTYYFNISLKKLSSNIIVLLFEPLVTKETLGIFALLLKVLQFILGLIRTIESIFLIRKNIEKYSVSFFKNGITLAILLQLIHISVGLVYMKFIDGNFYTIFILGMSFLVYPYIFYVKARAYFIAQYKNKAINLSYILFVLFVIAFYSYKLIINDNVAISGLVLLFSGSWLLQMSYLIYAEKRNKNEGIS